MDSLLISGLPGGLVAGVSPGILLNGGAPSTPSPMTTLTDPTFWPIIPFVFLANGLFTSVLAAVFLGLDRRQRPPRREAETGELRRAA